MLLYVTDGMLDHEQKNDIKRRQAQLERRSKIKDGSALRIDDDGTPVVQHDSVYFNTGECQRHLGQSRMLMGRRVILN